MGIEQLQKSFSLTTLATAAAATAAATTAAALAFAALATTSLSFFAPLATTTALVRATIVVVATRGTLPSLSLAFALSFAPTTTVGTNWSSSWDCLVFGGTNSW